MTYEGNVRCGGVSDGEVELLPLDHEHLSALYGLMGAAPEYWPICSGFAPPSPSVFYESLTTSATCVFTILKGHYIVGYASIVGADFDRGTAWVQCPAPEQLGLADTFSRAKSILVRHAFFSHALVKVSAIHHAYEAPFFANTPFTWKQEAVLPRYQRHESGWWDRHITSVFRVGEAQLADRATRP